MKALILAAGIGKRLRPLTNDRPKCMVEVDRIPILRRQVDALHHLGVDDIAVVTGYMDHLVSREIGNAASYVANPEYEATGSLHSMLLAESEFRGQEFVLINADVVFDAPCLGDLINASAETAALVDRTATLLDGEMNVVIEDGRITRFSKEVSAEEASALSLQVTKFGASDSERLFDEARRVVVQGATQQFPAVAYARVMRESTLSPVQHESGFWAEIDTLGDYYECEQRLRAYCESRRNDAGQRDASAAATVSR